MIVGDRLAGVIDFGLMGVGDPACDLMAAWTCFCGPVRSFFRDAAPGDAGDWVRGRGWALSTALIALAAYRGTHPAFESAARRTIKEVVEDRA